MSAPWQFNTAPWALAIALLFTAASIWFFFRSLAREGGSPARTALHVVRLLAALLVAFTLLRPERVVTVRREEQPRLAILWDASGSMATRDVAFAGQPVTSRAEWLQARLKEQFWQQLSRRYRITVSPFSTVEKKGADDAGTDLNAALAGALAQNPDLRAVLLLSDGDWNTGKSPLAAAAALAQKEAPVFTIGLGKEEFLPDLDLQAVAAPSYGLVDERISVVFTLQNHLPREVRTTVTLHGPGGAHGSRPVTLPPMGQVQDALVFTPSSEGEGDYTVSVPLEPGEALPENNERSFHLAVRRETLQVLVVDSLPRWEFRYLRNALARDPGVRVQTLLYQPELGAGEGVGYLREFPAKLEDLQGFDVVFLGDVGVGPGQLTQENATLLKGLVEQQASGLVFLPGQLGREKLLAGSALEDLLPVELDFRRGAGLASAAEARLELTFRGKDHWLTMLAPDPEMNQRIWRNLPGFSWYAPVVKAKAGSEVLAVHEAARNEFGRIPLLVTRPAGNGKVLFMGTDSAWRWRKGVEDTYHYRFWGQVVRWMAHQRHLSQQEGMRLFYTPETPKRGDRMRLNATVLDRLGVPSGAGRIVAAVTAPSGSVENLELAATTDGWGVHSADFVPHEGGRYSVELKATGDGRRLQTHFEVAQPSLEKVGLPAKLSVLQEIAALTGGRSGGPADLDQMVRSLELLPERQPEERRFRLWCSPIWCAALLSLFTLYWAGRKVAGLT